MIFPSKIQSINVSTLMQILKREIHLPELLRVRVSDLLDYPPKFLAYIKAATSTTSDPPKLQVKGLDIENFSFEILTPSKHCIHVHFYT